MRNSWIVWLIVIIVIALGAWWYFSMSGQSQDLPADTTNSGTETGAQPSGALGVNGGAGQTNTGEVSVKPVLAVATDSKLGGYLVGGNGMTLYMYTKDAKNVSNCSGQCAVNWPPYTVSGGEPLLGASGVSGQLGTISRADGSMQVTYNGVPLYFWKSDTKVGDTTGENVGGVWFVVKP